MDALRARAFLDILLGTDSRPLDSKPHGARMSQDRSQPDAPSQRPAHDPAKDPARAHAQAWDPVPPVGGPLARMIPPGFAGHVTLTIPAATLTDRADRPGDLAGIGPVDPDPGANT